MEFPNVATEKELEEVVVEIKKEYCFSQLMGESSSKLSLIYLLCLEESVLISYQSLMAASDCMKKLDGFGFVIEAPEGLHNPIPIFNVYGLLHAL